MIVFTHVPKCAGLLIRESILKKNCHLMTYRELQSKFIPKDYLSSYLYNSDNTFSNNPECLTGHFPHGIHKLFDIADEDVSYFTFLRDPVKRWLSNFYFYQNIQYVRVPGNEYTKLFDRANRNFKNFLELSIKENWTSNAMVRQFSGSENIEEIEKRTIKRINNANQNNRIKIVITALYEYTQRILRSAYYTHSLRLAFKTYRTSSKINKIGKKNHELFFFRIINSLYNNFTARLKGFDENTLAVYSSSFCQTKKYSDKEYMGFLEDAKKNLSKYKFIGLGENVEEEIIQLCNIYNWEKPTTFPKFNETSYFRLKKMEIDEDEMEMIKELNKYDILLYDWVKKNINNKGSINA